ncbi:UDP-N-acetylmuramoyl-tripeptide--D-alanyl-D-alanine ligase [Variovorax paradoxus]|uniref:UDP-N-acetylmuramoyl-tripeptide--D-alanyl-D- alanine ligase n=1 Tax=Variovorax paradoxus TaxID=34073 RepID=UPI0029C95327|nr:UDP-N-acetylmuramoyl-tripeptide--D-alanyl-D-alanine ligase [Variovorax paradoxus]
MSANAQPAPGSSAPDAGWTAAELADVTDGSWLVAPADHAWRALGICAESSQFKPGQMVLAQAGAAGLDPAVVGRLLPYAAGVIAQSEKAQSYAHQGRPVLAVKDLRETVAALGADARRRFAGTVVAVTGSVGKTSTVAMAAHTLASAGESDRSRTSANSPYGIAWNFASMNREAAFWVQEVAATRMEICSELMQAHAAIVTAIAPAHVARFGSVEAIARQKAKIYGSMTPGGIAVINADMPEFAIFEAAALAARLRVVRFGSLPGVDARLLDVEGSMVRVDILGLELAFELGAAGRHMAMNATAVLAAVAALGLPVHAAAQRLGSFEPLRGRGQRSDVVHAGKRIQVWDESYNANPASMRAALHVMRDAGNAVPNASRLLVLGDMLELGEDAQTMHLELESEIRSLHPDRVLLCGPQMRALWERLSADVPGAWYADIKALLPAVGTWLRDGDVVLVKSSNGTGLTNVVRLLSGQLPQPPVHRDQVSV